MQPLHRSRPALAGAHKGAPVVEEHILLRSIRAHHRRGQVRARCAALGNSRGKNGVRSATPGQKTVLPRKLFFFFLGAVSLFSHSPSCQIHCACQTVLPLCLNDNPGTCFSPAGSDSSSQHDHHLAGMCAVLSGSLERARWPLGRHARS